MKNVAMKWFLVRTLCLVALGAAIVVEVPTVWAQGSRKDDIVLSSSGHPIPGAMVRVCQAGATGTPCSPLATVYTDATLTAAAANPFQSDGIGNYHFYAPAGRYVIQISGPGITGTRVYPDVILAPDVSSSGSGNDISAFGLTLGGNLSVAGNATINGTLTTANFNPGVFTPSSLSVSGSETVAGPRPRTDVTGFGAKGDGLTDDTAAIQAAINTVCAEDVNHKSTLFFPPGNYIVSQPQSPSTSPVFTGFCSGLVMEGSGSNANLQFGTAPMSRITVRAGSSPNASAVFAPAGANGIAFKNIEIAGYNQAVYLIGGNGVTFNNTCLTSSATSMADNVPLKMSQVIQVTWNGGCIQAPDGSHDDVLIIGADTGGTETQPAGLIFFNGSGGNFWIGDGVHYDQRVNTCCSGPGNFHFWNILVEDATAPIFRVTNSTGNPGNQAMPGMHELDFQNFEASDGSPNVPMVNFNSSGSLLSGVQIKNFNGGGGGYAIEMQAGTLQNCSVAGGAVRVLDGSGNPAGDCIQQNNSGLDFIANTGNTDRLRADISAANDGTAIRATAAGNPFASLAVDPAQGVLFSDGTSYGYNAQVYQSTKEALDIGFASTLPPTGVTGTATTGGTLAAGTYYYFVRSTTSSACSTTMSAPSVISNGVALSGSNNAVSLTWTAPPAGAASAAGYCIFRSTQPTNYSNQAQYPSVFVSGASTTSYTDLGTGFGCCNLYAPYNVMQSAHRFTPTSLGVNTTNPQFNLDVNGTAAVNSLNGVAKAERFTGSDAVAKINACLTAAASTSGLCDARGLAGTFTASSHISVPAGTTLLWGPAQLTVNDTTTKDAIELMGDGASVIGYQETGQGTVPRPDTSGYIACGIAGCTTVDNPNSATRNVDWIHIHGMYLLANGASSTVLNLTSVGHADIENNRFILGSGGGSYGIYGNTSTGNQDSTNSLIKHNEFDPESQNDTCAYLAGVFNSLVFEQNSCYLPAANTGTQGFVLAKDTNGNYPDNDEFYGNDCEAATTSFGQVCFNIMGAQSIVIGPNNRCENVYNCFEFPADGSAVGIHLLDPYISLSANTVIKPNEPAAAMLAIDNNGHNWQPSMHFGMNDLAGANVLGNAGFEGWQNATTLFYWGGVSGTSINQGGSGIYAQETSAGANPAADSYTQGTYNVRVGDGATAGLGLNSACIQVDSTLEYTLMFRVASGSTSDTFRPGFRFYSDPNCTEANKITNVATNARVLSPANYAGVSTLAGTGANWQSTNASLTYNNGITCNCSVTGADWQVATANAWTASRNFGITFRVPNAYSNASTIAHSMRAFLLENTAAANNYVYFDDVVLGQGPVSPDLRAAPLADSGSGGTVNGYASYNFSGNVTLQANTGFGGTLTHNNTANRTYTFPDSSGTVALQTPLASWGLQHSGSAQSFSSNAVKVWGIIIPYGVSFSHLDYSVSTLDSNSSDNYDVGLYGPCAVNTASCPLVAHIGAQNLSSTGYKQTSVSSGTIQPGLYWIAITGNATTAQVATTSVSEWTACPSTNSTTTSTGGALPSTIATPNCSAPQWTGGAVVGIGLE
ncbi:MAG TPA: glycosyl hydrolase family 28-related protein [Candidatus Limnocylindrales bacterium]|nr:glycosyl hydrolase family 28-related protein [Candidatus Limnocylindrales bacterium]